ncbi:hydroxysteroid dehydrogenase, putative [Acanthamoeba castellanii str. Neff]|uniref:Hydroxysteroid dehydrogenase, putative n=1 Tax=Acanthamoeba castellanii (strain ATCC 30010 / Neff) TaxID=1257118 RepID=L8GYL0_ACACF|nr:hydroxysteroid dehydrogenase, putative [Acanthamoeba castellanii str. Neff]ELR17598.1 hydroxysteroid dehydrogenase, putative [Acanthamoeba castellanii str. Neff]
MGDSLRFDGKVVVVTGAGGGLGKTYALLFASRGASVVVNDLGTSHTGEGAGSKAADLVVEEIKKAGGKAAANYDSVENGEAIIKTAIDNFGRVDIVINNAGILRDVSFVKMKQADWDLIYKVHLHGAYSVTKAAWPYMRDQGFGRVIMTSSAAGLYGNFGQANYSAMKLALVGFAKTLAAEGKSRNIHVNTIAPVAGTRMTATVMPPELIEALKPEFVSPLVAFLCHESTPGNFYDVSKGLTPEAIRDNWAKDSKQAPSAPAAKAAGGNENVDPSQVVGFEFPVTKVQYTEKEVMLYALSIGAAKNPTDPAELKFAYENSDGFSVLPTFGVTFPNFSNVLSIPGLKFNPMMLLHGEQYLEIRKPIPVNATLTNHGRVKHLYDKGKGALLVVEADTKDEKGEVVVHNESYLFIRGIGGFGGERGPSGNENQPPNRAPDAVHKEKTRDNEALVYRLASGDMNPLHADPSMAAMGGFDRPILHGLCSFGYASRAVLKHFCDNDPANFKDVKVRFSKHVFPGETLVTEMWKEGDKVIFQCKVEERGEYCITNAAVTVSSAASSSSASASAAAAAASSAPAFKAEAVLNNLSKLLDVAGEAVVKKVNGIYHFHITDGPNGAKESWVVDLKTGPKGTITRGAPTKPVGVTLTLGDDSFQQLFSGKLNAQQAFMQGKLKIKGDMGLATKLGELIKQQAKL